MKKRSLWQFGLLFFLGTILSTITLVLVSPDRFIQESITGDYFTLETTSALELHSKLYLLQPNVVLQSSLESLDWVETYTIERSLPNQVKIVYQASRPVACSATFLHYPVSQFARSNKYEVLCENSIRLTGSFDATELESLVLTAVETRNLIERIEFRANDALVTMKNGQQAVVYTNDFSVLQSIAQLAPSGTVLDLRRNYA